MSKRDQEDTDKEARILRRLNHPHVVKFIESFLENDALVIIMEYCAGGDLKDFLQSYKDQKRSIPNEMICSMFAQLASAIAYIHSQKIMHRDIKTSNVYLTEDGRVKLGDFGIAKVLEFTAAKAMTVVGTPYYMSPEICNSQSYSYKSEVWSLGVLLYELCTQAYPFTASSLIGLVMKITAEPIPRLASDTCPELAQAVNSMLNRSVEQRPTVAGVLTMPIFQPYLQAMNAVERVVPAKLPKGARQAPQPPPAQQNFTSSVVMQAESIALGPSERVLPQADDLTYSVTLEDTVRLELSGSDGYSDSFEEGSDYSDDFESDNEELVGPAAGLKEQVVARLGKHNFQGMYQALKEMRQMNTPDNIIMVNLEALYGAVACDCFHLVDQIIYYESQ